MATSKGPPRQLQVKDVNGTEVLVKLERTPQRTTRVQFAYAPPMISVRLTFGISDTLPVLVQAPHLLDHHEATWTLVPLPTWQGTEHPQLRTAPNRTDPSQSTDHVYIQELDDSPNWQDTNYIPFKRAVAERILHFIETFHTHFAQGHAAAKGRETKEAKLGRALVLRKKLDVWRNPTRDGSQRYEADEHLQVACYPDSGTDTLKLSSPDAPKGEASSPPLRPPLFTSMRTIMTRMDPHPKRGETIGNESALVLVYPIGLTTYETELRFVTAQSGRYVWYHTRVGLYARALDLWALWEDLKNVQQGGSQLTDRPENVPYARPDFPARNFPMGVEVEVRVHFSYATEQAGRPPNITTYVMHVEYDGRDTKGVARLQLVPRTPHSGQSYDSSLFTWNKTTKSYTPNTFYVTQLQLAQGDIRLAKELPKGHTQLTNVWLPVRESNRLLVALDYRMERGLRGLQFGGLMRRLTGGR